MPSDILGSEILDKNREFTLHQRPYFFQYNTGRQGQQNPAKNPSSPVRSHARKIGYHCRSLLSIRAAIPCLSHTKPYRTRRNLSTARSAVRLFYVFIQLDYPSFQEEVQVVKSTTSIEVPKANPMFSREDILKTGQLIRKVPTTDNLPVRLLLRQECDCHPDQH